MQVIDVQQIVSAVFSLVVGVAVKVIGDVITDRRHSRKQKPRKES